MLCLGLASCVDKYWPELNKYDNVLVVDGLLTNGNDTTIVKLSMSSPVNNEEFNPLSGAELYITDNNQTQTYFTETEPGAYKILDNTFIGNVGSSYQLHILLPNGKKYRSDICVMKPPAPIDSIFGEIETHQIPNTNDYDEGVQFYINNHSNLPDTSYYLWKLIETFEYQSSFNIDYIWNGNNFDPYPNPDSLRTCWFTTPVPNIFTYSTKYLNKPIINNLPLNFVNSNTKRLSVRYSLLVKQLSITKKIFNFWDALRQQNIIQGNLYSKQPVQIRGNVKNINNPEEPVLGYFTVAGMTKKRIFINKPPIVFYYDICSPDFDGMRFIRFEPGPIYIVDINGRRGLGNTEACFDCRIGGGKITRPDFW